MASAVQERRQAPADGPGRASKENPVTHHRYSFVTMRPNRRFHRKARPEMMGAESERRWGGSQHPDLLSLPLGMTLSPANLVSPSN
jgi:hypothetical protein